MQGTNRSFVGCSEIALELVVSSTPNWSHAWEHAFGQLGENWSHVFVALTTTWALCHLGGVLFMLASSLVPC